ncbi:MAG TPA: N-acyl homoserine lactonase family protein [Methylomirabilota bacterium]|jgi:N-acyl homoserine lactone hydrolase|nr:N-acyl homoserine lactonase family protein [Methylomirabilota bacterium]
MRRSTLALISGTLVFLLAATTSLSLAQGPAPAGMKMYAFSSGGLTIAKSALQSGASSNQITVPVGFFVVMHPKGNFLFDTGNNDKIINDPSYWGPFIKGLTPERGPDVAIDTQLKKINLTPDSIKYVAVGHMHLDHGGNVCKFPNATFLVQKAEMKNAAWPEPGTAGPYIPGDVSCLRNDMGEALPNKFKMEQLAGDWDVFGDGSVVLKSWPGHTPGSQMAIVRLPKTGTVILTSDNVYFSENVTKNLLPDISLAYDPPGILNAYAYIRAMQGRENASFMTAHDPDGPAGKARSTHAPQLFE